MAVASVGTVLGSSESCPSETKRGMSTGEGQAGLRGPRNLPSQDQMNRPGLRALRGWKVKAWERHDVIAVFKYLNGNQNLGLF